MLDGVERIAETRAPPSDAGSLLIDFLSRRFTYLSREGWLDALAAGALAVNGEPAAAGAVLAAGDLVRFSPKELPEPPADVSFRLVYEDADALVVDKPANLPVHPGGRFFSRTLWYLLRELCPCPRIVTRLDRETSGLVLAAKSAAAARRLQAEGAVDKRYLVLVHGSFPERLTARGVLTADLRSAVRKKRAYVDAADPGFSAAAAAGEACLTEFELERLEGDASLLQARLGTGRTHQIRATLRSLGYPVVGDKLYGKDEGLFLRFAAGTLTEADRAALRLPGQALRCVGLGFDSAAGRRVEAEAAAPAWAAPGSAAGRLS